MVFSIQARIGADGSASPTYSLVLSRTGSVIAKPTPAPEPSPTPSLSLDQTPLEPTGSSQFGVVLIASSIPQVALEQANKSKSVAPANAEINIYHRKSVWAVVVLYSDNSKAGVDLANYKQEKDWSSAYVVKLDTWCPMAKPISLSLPPPIGAVTAVECKMR